MFGITTLFLSQEKESTWPSGHRHTMNANWQKGKSHLILEIMFLFFFFNDTIGKSVVEKSGLKTLKFCFVFSFMEQRGFRLNAKRILT